MVVKKNKPIVIQSSEKIEAASDCTKTKQEAVKYIRSAIDALAKSAKDDVICRESIANLSVVLFDLQ